MEWKEAAAKAAEMARSEYRPQLVSFYTPFFDDEGGAEQFVDHCHARMDRDPRPGRVLHNVERLMGLADDVLGLRRGRDAHLVFFAMVCIEAIHQTADRPVMSKVNIIEDFFRRWVPTADQQFLQQRVVRSAADDRWTGSASAQLPVETIARIFNAVRNDFVHEGVGWGFHFCSADRVPLLNHLELGEGAGDAVAERTYEIALTRGEFRSAIVRGAIELIRSLQ